MAANPADAQAPAAPAKSGNVFTNKIGPLPMWVWLIIVAVPIIGYALYKKSQAGATTASTAASTTDASQVPQFVNQTYTTVTPPTAGPPGPAGPTGPAGPPGPLPEVPPNKSPKPPAKKPGPKEISGGPPVGGLHMTRAERLRQRGNVLQIANRNGVALDTLLAANPDLQKYAGTGKMVPAGTTVQIPTV